VLEVSSVVNLDFYDFIRVSSVFMTQDLGNEWMKRTAAAIGARVRQAREENGMSVQGLADACTALGYKMLRTTLVNLEAGARKNITVGELSVIAAALETGPLALIVPLEEDLEVEVLPGQKLAPWSAWKWFSNEHVVTGDQYWGPNSVFGDAVNNAQLAYRDFDLYRMGYDMASAAEQKLRDHQMATGGDALSSEGTAHWISGMEHALSRLEGLGVEKPDIDPEYVSVINRFRSRRSTGRLV
jgi:transcriptional regulator with XRE-family HTH domain